MKYLRSVLCGLGGLGLCGISSIAFGSEGVDDIIKLQRSGIESEVEEAYVRDSAVAYNLSAEDIQRMEDANVPAVVIVAMLDHGKQLRNEPRDPQAADVAPAIDVAQSDTNVEVVAPAEDKADISLFYEAMAPYGTWSQDETNGWTWEPRDGADANWRPYASNGHWEWTDHGWYWESASPYGWAAYHYGRWGYNSRNRWSWSPDNVWGPAWVDWRQSDENIGWAPLPFGSRFDNEAGFTFRGNRAGFDFHAGLSERDYSFVQSDRFLDSDISIVLIPENRRHDVYGRTTVVKNTYAYNDNRIVNNGVSTTVVSRATHRKIEPVKVVDANISAGQPIRAERRNANTIETYRPKIANTAAVAPPAVVERQKAAAARASTRVEAAAEHKSVTQAAAKDKQAAQEAARSRLAAEKAQRKNTAPETKTAARTPAPAKPAEPAETAAQREERTESAAERNKEVRDSQPARPVAQPRTEPAKKPAEPTESAAQREEQSKNQADVNRAAREAQAAKSAAAAQEKQTERKEAASEKKATNDAAAAEKKATNEAKKATNDAAAAERREEATESKEEKAREKKDGK